MIRALGREVLVLSCRPASRGTYSVLQYATRWVQACMASMLHSNCRHVHTAYPQWQTCKQNIKAYAIMRLCDYAIMQSRGAAPGKGSIAILQGKRLKRWRESGKICSSCCLLFVLIRFFNDCGWASTRAEGGILSLVLTFCINSTRAWGRVRASTLD